jgi:hypothetical protein
VTLRPLLPVLLLAFLVTGASAQVLPPEKNEARDSVRSAGVEEFREIPQSAFAVGERLVFDVGYSFLTAGEAVFTIPKIDTVNGREAYQIVFTVNSTPTFSWIYKVEDRYETLLDRKGLFPWRFTQRIREGTYSRDFSAEFDQVNYIARTTEGDYPIPPYVHDIVSAFYFTRTIDFSNFRVGQTVELQNFYKDTTHTLGVKFLGYQRVKVPAGTFDCILIEPLVREGGLFKSDGRVIIWLTNDERKIPVKVTTRIIIGTISSELREVHGVVGPIRARVR